MTKYNSGQPSVSKGVSPTKPLAYITLEPDDAIKIGPGGKLLCGREAFQYWDAVDKIWKNIP